jgi:hypothetical protein
MTDEDLKGLLKLDRKKDYGQVYPAENGAHYDQNGFLFDHHGALCVHLLGHEQRNKLQAMAMKKEADKAADKARQDYFAKQGIEGDKIAELTKLDQLPVPPAAAEGEIDLVAWAERKGPPVAWAKVRDAAMKEYSLGFIKSADDLRQWMVEEKKVSPAVLQAQ